MKKIITYFIFICSSLSCFGQSKVTLEPNKYLLSVTGDTINRTDHEGLRSGLWNIYHESHYGDDSYFEIGTFFKNKKHGSWKTYSKSGIILKDQNYYNNFLNGESKYYDNGQLSCVGQYKALRTDVAYDTILVEDPASADLIEKIIPTSLGSVKHGFWTYYKPPYNEIRKVEEYQVDELIYEQDYVTKSDSLQFASRLKKYPHKTNGLPVGFWSNQKGKAPPRYTDFPENVKYVKPNPGKKTKH